VHARVVSALGCTSRRLRRIFDLPGHMGSTANSLRRNRSETSADLSEAKSPIWLPNMF